MPILSHMSRRSIPHRLMVAAIYTLLSVFGVTMIIPFMMTVTSSLSNAYDYEDFRPVPRYFYSQNDRFVKGLVEYFNTYKEFEAQMAANFHSVPAEWSAPGGWPLMGRDPSLVDAMARPYLNASPAVRQQTETMAHDYADFAETYPVENCLAPVDGVILGDYLEKKFEARWAALHPQDAARMSAPEREAAALHYLGEIYGIPYTDFNQVAFGAEQTFPYWQQQWIPPSGPKYQTFLEVKEAYRNLQFSFGLEPKWKSYLESHHIDAHGVPFPVPTDAPADLRNAWLAFKREVSPATPTIPFALRAEWRKYLTTNKGVRAQLVAQGILDQGDNFGIDNYNDLAGTSYKSFDETPFPPPPEELAPPSDASAPDASTPSPAPAATTTTPAAVPAGVASAPLTTPAPVAPVAAPPAAPAKPEISLATFWKTFTEKFYPIRLMSIPITPELTAKYQQYLETKYKTVSALNILLGTSATQWTDFVLTPELPKTISLPQKQVWIDFVKATVPIEQCTLHSSEADFQQFMLKRYGSLDAINKAWGTHYGVIQQVFPPFDKAYAVTFSQNEWNMTLSPALRNYYIIVSYVFTRSRAVWVTLLLIVMHIVCTLTVNPFAAYALSRFNLRGQKSVIIFLLATSAFPAVISAIPGYLLLRDLGMLNTFWALVIPGSASGLSIFILKGFFDSLPPELFEAATIDGAKEWQIFSFIMMPMVKPILAIHCLHAFIAAYVGWEWALIVCQDPHMWTLSVWMYQASVKWAAAPWIVNAGYIVLSIPTMIVFLTCQKVILRGIVIPQMK